MGVKNPWSINRKPQPLIFPALRYFISFSVFWEAAGSSLLMSGVSSTKLINKMGSCVTIPAAEFLSCGNSIAVCFLFWPNLDCKYTMLTCVWRGLESSFCKTDVVVALEIRGMFPLVHCCGWVPVVIPVKGKLQNSISAEDTWGFTKGTVKLDNLYMYLLKHLQLPFQRGWHNKYQAQKSSSVSECLIKFLLFKLRKSDLDRLRCFFFYSQLM